MSKSSRYSGYKSILLLAVCSILVNNVLAQGALIVKESKDKVQISNGLVMAIFEKNNSYVNQQYYSKREGKWLLVLKSFRSPDDFPQNGVLLFNEKLDPEHRFLVSSRLHEIRSVKKDSNAITVVLTGEDDQAAFSQEVTLKTKDKNFSVRVHAILKKKPYRLDYLLSTFEFNLPKAPEFVHTPGVKFDNEDSHQNRFPLLPSKDQIIGDRAFHAPAVILQEKNLFAALVPDLNAINRYSIISEDARRTSDIPRNMFSVPILADKYTMPTGLDLNVNTGLTNQPVITFGLMDNIIAHHIRYQRRNDKTMVRSLDAGNLIFAFDLFVDANEIPYKGFRKISEFQWKKYGHQVFINHPHLVMPFEGYLQVVDSITFQPGKYPNIDIPLKDYEDHGSWLSFNLNGAPAGGYRSSINSWNDVIHNSIFWNNARDASGFWFWGQETNQNDLIDKAHRIINFCLAAPKNKEGLFATLYNANSKTWGLQFSDPPHGKNQLFLRESESYDIAAMSKTGAHLLDYYTRCEKDERIINYLKPYASWLASSVDSRGTVPSYVSTDMKQSSILRLSAQPAASMWFLAAMYNITKLGKFKQAATRISDYLEREVIPREKWMDMEQYYSCGAKPLDFQQDVWQKQPLRGNLCTIWASEGYARLYEATKEKKYLDLGTSCIDYLSFSQCCWAPNFIYTAFPFGGFTADNADNSTMLDARQAEAVKPFIWYGKILGRQDLLERGVAAARASVVLMNLPAHQANNIYKYVNIYPFGLGPENIDHEGQPQSAMRTNPSWGEGSGVFTGLAEAYRALDGGYIDFKANTFVGVNGITINKIAVRKDTASISISDCLNGLKLSYNKCFTIELQLNGLDRNVHLVEINGKVFDFPNLSKIKKIKLSIFPDGTFGSQI